MKKSLWISLILMVALMFAQPAQAQTVQLDWKDFSIGAGSMLGEESTTFSWDAAFGAVHWHGVSLFGDNGSTGAGIEIHPASVFYLDGVQQIETIDYRIWNLNRAKASVLQLPGDIWESMYLGADVLIAEGGGIDFTKDFDARFVYGVKEGPIQFEIYMFEKYRPVSFAVFYRF